MAPSRPDRVQIAQGSRLGERRRRRDRFVMIVPQYKKRGNTTTNRTQTREQEEQAHHDEPQSYPRPLRGAGNAAGARRRVCSYNSVLVAEADGPDYAEAKGAERAENAAERSRCSERRHSTI